MNTKHESNLFLQCEPPPSTPLNRCLFRLMDYTHTKQRAHISWALQTGGLWPMIWEQVSVYRPSPVSKSMTSIRPLLSALMQLRQHGSTSLLSGPRILRYRSSEVRQDNVESSWLMMQMCTSSTTSLCEHTVGYQGMAR